MLRSPTKRAQRAASTTGQPAPDMCGRNITPRAPAGDCAASAIRESQSTPPARLGLAASPRSRTPCGTIPASRPRPRRPRWRSDPRATWASTVMPVRCTCGRRAPASGVAASTISQVPVTSSTTPGWNAPDRQRAAEVVVPAQHHRRARRAARSPAAAAGVTSPSTVPLGRASHSSRRSMPDSRSSSSDQSSCAGRTAACRRPCCSRWPARRRA